MINFSRCVSSLGNIISAIRLSIYVSVIILAFVGYIVHHSIHTEVIVHHRAAICTSKELCPRQNVIDGNPQSPPQKQSWS